MPYVQICEMIVDRKCIVTQTVLLQSNPTRQHSFYNAISYVNPPRTRVRCVSLVLVEMRHEMGIVLE